LVRVSTPRNTKVYLWVETRIRLDLEQIYFFRNTPYPFQKMFSMPQISHGVQVAADRSGVLSGEIVNTSEGGREKVL